jgi:hypothetical protein
MDEQPRTVTESLQQLFSTSNQLAVRMAEVESITSSIRGFSKAFDLDSYGLFVQMNNAFSVSTPTLEAIMGTHRDLTAWQAALAPINALAESMNRIREFYDGMAKSAARCAALSQMPPSLRTRNRDTRRSSPHCMHRAATT